jgi:predicted ribosome quality control (RQC) complex YloA/Tae2 family protein
MELTSLDLVYVAKELQTLIGAKVEKIYQSENKRDVLFALYLKDTRKMNLRFLLPGLVCAAKERPAYPQMPPGFAVFLRKYLGGTRIQSVQQSGFDRILIMEFASKTAAYSLVIELFHPGNMLLLSEGRIVNLMENQQFKDRTLRGRQPYVAPPASYDLLRASDQELADRITASTKDSIVTTLAIGISLGGVYAEEACARAGIAKHRNDLSAAEVHRIAHAIRSLLDEPIAAHRDSKRAYPFRLQSRELTPCEETSFISAMSAFVEEAPAAKQEVKQKASPRSKLQVILDAQRQQISRFEQEAAAEQRKGERIYEEYQLLQDIMQVVHEARSKKQDIAAALKRFSQVKGYRDATGEIEIELADSVGDA